MLLSINWLKEFIKEPIQTSVLAEKLTMAGIEVEEIINYGEQWNNIVTAEIIQINPHPNADKLSLTTVSTGDKTYPVVCGATNISPGIKIALAQQGAVFPGGLKIKRSKIRGEISEGMICSETELELGNDSSGIMILPPDTITGLPIADALGLNDTVLDLDITPNRCDCLSMLGLAREISAIFDVPLVFPEINRAANPDKKESSISVEVTVPKLCPKYTACVINGVTIAPSPLWMRRRLEVCGIRPINNIVDITNYILLESGQPLHSFDLNFIKARKIIVRTASEGEKFITLDQTEHILKKDTLLVCDSEKPIAIAGIMGGLNSGVTLETKDILLESAFFIPGSIAAASRALNLKTESSQRFEKGVDINGVVNASKRATELILANAGGLLLEPLTDMSLFDYNNKKNIKLSIPKTRKITGIEIKQNETRDILERLSIKVVSEEPDFIEVETPGYRYDLRHDVDLMEEIIRIKGYNHIPTTFPKAEVKPVERNMEFSFSCIIRDIFTAIGFYEVINYSFISAHSINHLGFNKADKRDNPVRLLNPISAEQSVLRTCIVPSLLQNLKDNLNNSCKTASFFEISKIFLDNTDEQKPTEIKRIAGLKSGFRYEESWNAPHETVDFYDIKGAVETLLDRLHIYDYRFSINCDEPYLNPNKSMALYINNCFAGSFGEVHPDVLEKYEIANNVFVFDLDFNLLASNYMETVTYQPYSKYPAIFRDIALLVDLSVNEDTVYGSIKSFKNKLITDIVLFDHYQGEKIPSDKKSLAFRIKFQSNERTLTDNEVNRIHDKILLHLSSTTGAELRN